MAIIYGRPDSEKQLLDKYPRQVKTIKDIPIILQVLNEKLEKNGNGLFGRIKQWNTQRQLTKFENNKDDPFHAGASGELQALDKLSQLSDEYHILCGLNIGVNRWITYNGKKNLKSAQMDFVVISKKGVMVIEVKNWSSRPNHQYHSFSPHEQVDRAGRVLWIALQSWRSPKKPKVNSLVLPVQGNIRYEPRYKYVCVSDLNSIASFLENRKEEFSDKEVKRLVNRLKNHVTH